MVDLCRQAKEVDPPGSLLGRTGFAVAFVRPTDCLANHWPTAVPCGQVQIEVSICRDQGLSGHDRRSRDFEFGSVSPIKVMV